VIGRAVISVRRVTILDLDGKERKWNYISRESKEMIAGRYQYVWHGLINLDI
jgi:hypothetical protein